MFRGGCGQFIGGIIVIVLVAFGCGLFSSSLLGDFLANNVTERFGTSVGAGAGQDIARRLGITLPSGAGDFYYAAKGNQGTWVRFSLPQSQVNGVFRGSTAINCPSGVSFFAGFRPIFVVDRELTATEFSQVSSWWTPQTATSFTARECTGQQRQVVRMMLDTTNPTVYTFYVEIIQPYG